MEHVYKLVFLCELLGAAPAVGLETTAVDFFPPDALPELSSGRTLAEDVRLLALHHRQPDRLPEFD